ncbi:integrase arm-type DNA-binding domain-containing protein [Acinetobacter sp. XH1741]|uniref:tyrosine-type recombinase/integrase n=1 Tax=unclassified Acinetobacter TaxID=196816 RepID=UPI0032B53CCA
MAKQVRPLTDTRCASLRPKDQEYLESDGSGLCLRVRSTGAKTWIFRYTSRVNGKREKITLGAYPALSLAKAREKRHEFLTMLAEGSDPKEQLSILLAKKNNVNTLENVVRVWLDAYAVRKPLSEDTKSKQLRKFENHLFPKFKDKTIEQITLRDLKDALNVIYDHSPDNAQRIRASLIQVYSYAVQHSYIQTNIARDLEDMDLSARKSHRATFRSLDLIPQLIRRIKADSGNPLTKLCLLLGLHTFLRSSEIRFARWNEIDLEMKVWRIPSSRTLIEGVKHSDRGAKMKVEHLVPLSEQSIEILKQIYQYSGSYDFVFPSPNNKRNFISENTPNDALRRMGYSKDEISFHGFRALARSALGEMSMFSRDALEKQMSHQERNETVGAYTHIAEYLEEREKIMQVWSDWLSAIREWRLYKSA